MRSVLGLTAALLGLSLFAPTTAHAGGDAGFAWGIGGGMGYFTPANLVDFNLGLRLGARINDKIAVHGELGTVFGLAFGASADGNGGSANVRALGMWHITPVIEYSLPGPFFVGGGPMLASGGWVGVRAAADDQGNTSQQAITAGGRMPGLDLRVGLIAGGDDTRRKGFSLTLDTKIMLAKVTEVTQQTGNGGANQAVTVGSRSIGITPMLVFGYDLR